MGAEINYELLVGLAPDLVLLYGIGGRTINRDGQTKRIECSFYVRGEYLEESPLGKAEWLVAISELTDSREAGTKVFKEIPERYNNMKQLTANVEKRPTVMLNTPWNDSWAMPSAKSYVAQLITDARGLYLQEKHLLTGPNPSGWKQPTG